MEVRRFRQLRRHRASTSEITPTARGGIGAPTVLIAALLTRSRTVSKRIDGAFRKTTIWLIAQEFGRPPLFVLQILEFYPNAQVDPSGEIIHISRGIGAQNVSVLRKKLITRGSQVVIVPLAAAAEMLRREQVLMDYVALRRVT